MKYVRRWPAFWLNVVVVLAVLPLITVETKGQSLDFQLNDTSVFSYYGVDDYGLLDTIPVGFGEGELTFQLWIKPDSSYPIGNTVQEEDRALNWSISDEMPYSSCCWWYRGNFLLDGHANGGGNGTFSLQFYGAGRLRWHWEDQSDYVVAQAWPANTTPSLLDGNWHLITCVRKFIPGDSSLLELWIDDGLVATETTRSQTDMHIYWDNWFNSWAQPGWFLGCEKQVAPGDGDHYEDYKGLVDEMRFYSRAKSAAEIVADYTGGNGCGSSLGLVGYFDFNEGAGNAVADSFPTNDRWDLFNVDSFPNLWNIANAPCVQPCSDSLVLSTDDSPLSGIFQAGIEIELDGSIEILTGQQAELRAPTINVVGQFEVQPMAILEISSDGCQ